VANSAYDGDCDNHWYENLSAPAISSSNYPQTLRILDKVPLGESNTVPANVSSHARIKSSSQLRALELFDAEFSGGIDTPRLPGRRSAEALDYFSDSDIGRLKASDRKSLNDVNQHVRNLSQDEKAALALSKALSCEAALDGVDEEEDYDHDNDVSNMKSDVDKYRQRGANMKALGLLNVVAAGEKYKPLTERPAPRLATGGGLTARQAANLQYEKRKKEKMEVKAKKKEVEQFTRRAPKLVVPVRKEKLAESTRKKKVTQDDTKNPETVCGMKCQLHWDREKEAQAKALRLLNEGFML
jgi:hypothetical protein